MLESEGLVHAIGHDRDIGGDRSFDEAGSGDGDGPRTPLACH